MPESVGGIRYNLAVNNAQFVAGMTQAGTAVNSLSAKMLNSKAFQTFTRWANRAALAAGALAGVLIYKSIGAYETQLVAEQQLAVIGQNRLKLTQAQIVAQREYASALQKVGVVGDESVLATMGYVSSFAQSAEAVKILTPLIIDHAVALDGANVATTSLRGKAELWGKTLAGETGLLSRYGIVLTDTQRAVFKTGTELERVNLISELIAEKGWKGMNERIAATPVGRVRQMKNELGDFSEQLGKEFLPTLVQFLKLIVGFVQTLGGLTNVVRLLIATFATFRLISSAFFGKLIVQGLAKLWAIHPLLALTVGTVGLAALFGTTYALSKLLFSGGSESGTPTASTTSTNAMLPVSNVENDVNVNVEQQNLGDYRVTQQTSSAGKIRY